MACRFRKSWLQAKGTHHALNVGKLILVLAPDDGRATPDGERHANGGAN